MLTVNVTLLQGTIRATSPDDLALTGDLDPGDWPPSPARLVAALVAGDGTRDRCRVTTGAELALFERARPPRIHASPRSQVLGSPLRERFVVANEQSQGTVQEYPARTAVLVRPGTRLCPLDPRLAYVWEDLDPGEEEFRALSARAARVGYLGCADSPVQLTLSRGFDPSRAPAAVWEPDPDGGHDLPVPFPGFVEVLDRAFDEWTLRRARRTWFRTERARYRAPDQPRPARSEAAWVATIWLRFEESLPGRAALRTAEALKAAVLDLYQRHVAGAGEVPALLHGHGLEGRGYQLAQWLTLPEVGHAYARGRLHGAAIMLPAGIEPGVVEGVRHAAWRLRELAVPGLRPVRVALHGGEARPWAANPNRWRRRARRWVAALPVVHERRRRGGPTLDDLAAWCEHAGFPRPVWARSSPVPLLEGSPALRPSEVFRDRVGVRRPYSYLELAFAEPVAGPVVLGRARQYGMGLMAPVGEGGRG
ncbi:MAG TPA: type I-U CRISPR-associated protein Csb2 [Candidatus Dormibacteraeota bacterium]|nr:type I-U CRISPR-associated protein Csb2 [Candidatus Dormibacteraeota bacterium]